MTPETTARLLCPRGFSRQEYCSGLPYPPPEDLPNPGIEPRSPTFQAVSLPSEPPGKPKNTGVGNLSLLQGFFTTQESNRGLLHCRRILYQLRYQGSPCVCVYVCVCVCVHARVHACTRRDFLLGLDSHNYGCSQVSAFTADWIFRRADDINFQPKDQWD